MAGEANAFFARNSLQAGNNNEEARVSNGEYAAASDVNVVVRLRNPPGVGMGAAVAKILRKDVPGDPVLGMRRTQRMRDLDTDKKMRQKRKLRRLDRVQRRYVGIPSGYSPAGHPELEIPPQPSGCP